MVVPLKYNRNQFSVRQLLLIAASWLLSIGVASPILFGLNQVPGRNPIVCKLEDKRFVVYSSICSFFVPCPVMLLLYYGMFHGLRRWSSRSQAGAGRCPLSSHLSLVPPPAGASTVPAFLSPASPSTVCKGTPSPPGLEEEPDMVVQVVESNPAMVQMDGASDSGQRSEEQRHNGPRKKREVRRGRRNSKSSRVSGRERKAMKVLPVVVGE